MIRRAVIGTTATLLLATSLAACGASGPSADDAASQVAKELAAGKLTAKAYAGARAAQRAYTTVVSGLGTIHPTVSVDGTDTNGDRATAHLSWSWPIGSRHWTYRTSVTMVRSGDRYLAQWSPADVAPGLGAGDRLVAVREQAKRGDIIGAHGVALVKPRPVVQFGIDKQKMVNTASAVASARRLAALVGVRAAPYAKLVRSSGPKAFVPALVLRTQDVPAGVRDHYGAIPGAVAVPGQLPLAPTREFAAALLGRVGPATAEIVKKSKGRVQAGDETGVSGLQLRYDEQLAGTPGVRVDKVHGKHVTRLFSTAPVPGKALHVTLDRRLQSLAERVLADVGPASALVAIRPSDGAVLAAASGPGSNGYDTATYGRYAPGSTMKIISSLALLRSGLTPRSTVHCEPSLVVDGKKFTNDSEYPPSALGDISLTAALANSCNTGFISQHARLHGDDLGQAAAALGFGVDHNVGYPAYFGQAPKPTSEVVRAADMIGQGQVLASPLAMATVVSSVVAGHAVLPELVAGQDVPKPQPAHPLTAKEDRELHAMMRAVVTTPTGTGAGLADVPGPPIIAKTGTAEFGSTPPLATHAWMVAGQGDLAVAVFVDRGHTGAGTAGPILESFLRQK